MNSTKQLSGDVRLSIPDKIWWLWHNFIAGASGYQSGRKAEFWHPATVATSDASPSRKMIDAFLETELPKLLPQKSLSVFDIGCGTGYIYQRLTAMGYDLNYTGLDVYKRTKFDGNVPHGRFVLSKIEDFQASTTYDLVISNTCLEHVEDDSSAVRKAFTLGNTQVHILPTFWSLFIYLWHGYRQYSPTSLQTLFGEQGQIYRLGGAFSFLLHFFFVTIPERIRMPFLLRRNRVYSWLCRVANTLDALLPFLSVMYVVVIRLPEPHAIAQ